jgi:hypothetical protein
MPQAMQPSATKLLHRESSSSEKFSRSGRKAFNLANTWRTNDARREVKFSFEAKTDESRVPAVKVRGKLAGLQRLTQRDKLPLHAENFNKINNDCAGRAMVF